jgi:hypothetical protein
VCKVGYIDAEGIRRGSAINVRIRSAKLRAIVIKTKFSCQLLQIFVGEEVSLISLL